MSRAPLRTLVHCAGRGGTVRLVNRDGTPGDYDLYREIVEKGMPDQVFLNRNPLEAEVAGL